MSDKVQHRKRNRGRLLHPRVPNKRPLAMILQDGLVFLDGVVSDEAHAVILAFVGTRPPGKAEEEGSLALGVFEVVHAGRNAFLKELGSVPC